MKRLAVFCTAAVLTITPAHAIEHENFSIYSQLFGASDIDDSLADEVADCSRYYQDGCVITFRHSDGKIITIMVQGDGDSFLAYCSGAFTQFDSDLSHAAQNQGQLLGYYLMLKASLSGGSHLGYTVNGCPFTVKQEADGLCFLISNAT